MPIYCQKPAAIGEGCPYSSHLQDQSQQGAQHFSMREQALHSAVGKGDMASTCKLLQCGHNVNCTNGQGETPLHQAIEQQNVALVCLLLEHGADASLVPHYGVGTLYQAVETGNLALVKILLYSHDCSLELSLPDQLNPLMLAVVREHVQVTRVLLQEGARINITNERGETPLVLAAMGKDPDHQLQLGILLLMNGADPSQRDPHGHAPAHYSWHNAFTAYMREYGGKPRMHSLLSNARKTVLSQLVMTSHEQQTLEEMIRQLPMPAALKDYMLFSPAL